MVRPFCENNAFYIEKAKKILESRPNLDVHTINSLEVFDENILGEFGEAFVHDCISYNLRDFSEFLETVKNPHKKEQFKTYYDTLVAIYGENIEKYTLKINGSQIEHVFNYEFNEELKKTDFSDYPTPTE